jgi:hypothetical protein
MRPEEVVMAPQQFEMIFQPLHSPSVAEGPTMQVGRALPDSQVQPFDVGSVQLAGILRISPRLVPTPCRTDPGFPLHFHHAIFSSFLHDLSVQASHPKESPDNLPIELESVSSDQWEMVSSSPGAEISKQGERVPITPLSDNGRRPEPRPDFDDSEDRNRWMLTATYQRANLVSLQFANYDLGNPLIVESATGGRGLLQPAIHRVPSNLLDSGNRGFIHALDTQRSDFVERSAAMLQAVINRATVPAEGPAAHLASETTAFAPAGWVKAKTNNHSQRGLCS